MKLSALGFGRMLLLAKVFRVWSALLYATHYFQRPKIVKAWTVEFIYDGGSKIAVFP